MKDALHARTGQLHVPYVFVGGKNYEGDVFTESMKAPGTEAVKILAAAGVTAPGKGGYFRP